MKLSDIRRLEKEIKAIDKYNEKVPDVETEVDLIKEFFSSNCDYLYLFKMNEWYVYVRNKKLQKLSSYKNEIGE